MMVSAAMTAAAVAEPAEAREYLQRGCSTRDGALCAASGRGEEGEGGGRGAAQSVLVHVCQQQTSPAGQSRAAVHAMCSDSARTSSV